MHYIAWRIGEGAVPYRDLFDMNFPGVYLLHMVVLKVFGSSDAGWRAFDLIWLTATSLAAAALAAPWGRLAAAGAGLFFAVYHLAAGAWQTGQRDFLLCPFLLLAALGVARWAEGPGGPASLALGGLAVGAGITVKPHAGLFAAALMVLVAIVARGAGRIDSRLASDGESPAPRRLAARTAAVFVAGVVAPSLAVVVWLAVAGALPAWYEIVVGYLVPLYSRLGRPGHWTFYRWHVAFPLAACIVAAGIMLGIKGVEAADAAWIAAKERRVSAIVADLDGRLGPEDFVQVLDTTEAGVHALLRLRAVEPTRFIYDFHFYHDRETRMVRRLREEFLGGFDAHPPKFVVLLERGWPAGGYERVDEFAGLRARLLAYTVDRRGDGYIVYAR